MAESFLKDKKRVLPMRGLSQWRVWVKGLYVGVPVVIIGSGGVERIIEIDLNAAERQMLDAVG